jgi:thiol-disulfide isomerase/thioredoxin
VSSRSLKAAILGLALLAGGCDRQPGPDSQQPAAAKAEKLSGVLDRSKAGEPLPDFTVKTTGGQELALPSLRGTPVLLNLWATWCGPCVIELPTLDKVAGERGDGLRVLTISQDAGQPEKVAGFLADKGGTNLEPWLDPDNDLSFHYATGTLPTTILYDAQGKEVWRYVGGMEWDSAEAATMLAEAE